MRVNPVERVGIITPAQGIERGRGRWARTIALVAWLTGQQALVSAAFPGYAAEGGTAASGAGTGAGTGQETRADFAPLHGRRPGADRAPQPVAADAAGSGELLWKSPSGLIPLPVLDISVSLDVNGIILHGTVNQRFANSTSETIEALYVFPLPEGAAVTQMEMRIGERRIVSVIEERMEAQRTYEAAKREGRKAALLQQQRPNLFATSAANINPGESIEVRLEFLQELAYDDGRFRLSFPLTYTPRFSPGPVLSLASPPGRDPANPAEADTDPTDGSFCASDGCAVPRASIAARIRSGFTLRDLICRSHSIRRSWDADTLVVETREHAVAADRDFTLEWQLTPDALPRSTLLTEDRPDGRYGLLMVLPPLEDGAAAAGLPTETLFIVDVSGSMAGPSIEQARVALSAALRRLTPGDTFNMMAFDDKQQLFNHSFVEARPETLQEALRWTGSLQPGGGTMILPALKLGLGQTWTRSDGRVHRMVFLTDGAVDNEEEIFDSVIGALGDIRLHTLGIGPAPNRYLMRKMALNGRGLCAFVSDSRTAANQIDAFFNRLDRPVLTDLSLVWEGAAPEEVYPVRLPDLHAGEPLFVSIRLPQRRALGEVTLRGRLRDGEWSSGVATQEARSGGGAGVAVRWGRAKVEALLDSMNEGADPGGVRAAVIDVSRAFHIVTRYTSLVAVEEFPTAVANACPARIPNGIPGAGGEMEVLPRGGTLGPLLLRIGIVLLLLGLLLIFFSWWASWVLP